MTSREFYAGLFNNDHNPDIVATRPAESLKDSLRHWSDDDELHLEGRPIIVAADGGSYPTLREATDVVTVRLIPRLVEVLPETAELQVVFIPEDCVPERRETEDADLDQEINDALDADTLERYGVKFTITGEFIVVRADDEICSPSEYELYRRDLTPGQKAQLTILEAGDGWLKRKVVLRQGQPTAEVGEYYLS